MYFPNAWFDGQFSSLPQYGNAFWQYFDFTSVKTKFLFSNLSGLLGIYRIKGSCILLDRALHWLLRRSRHQIHYFGLWIWRRRFHHSQMMMDRRDAPWTDVFDSLYQTDLLGTPVKQQEHTLVYGFPEQPFEWRRFSSLDIFLEFLLSSSTCYWHACEKIYKRKQNMVDSSPTLLEG